MKRLSAVLVGALFILSVVPTVAAKTPKSPVFKTKTITSEITEVNVPGQYVMIKEGKKKTRKIITIGAVIVGVNNEGGKTMALGELAVNQKAQFVVRHKKEIDGSYYALLVHQVLSTAGGTGTGGTTGGTTGGAVGDQPIVQFASASVSGVENGGLVNLQLTLSKASTQDVKATFAVSGTATPGSVDFKLEQTEVTFVAGQTVAFIPFVITEDTTVELDETVVVTLTSATNAVLGATKVTTYLVQDNDRNNIQFSLTNSTGLESAALANLQVALSTPLALESKVNYTVTGTASGSGVDYTLANGQLTIPAGQTIANVPVVVVDDAVTEASETVIVTLSSPVNAVLGANTVHTYTIQDNDQARIQFSSSASSGLESVVSITIPVTLSGTAPTESRANYTVTGTASGSGVDFTLGNGTVAIAAGQTTTNIAFSVSEDTLDEVDETVVITLSSPTGAIMGTQTVHTYTIQDNDDPTP